MNKQNNILKKDTTTIRTFSYGKGNVSLNFNIRTDIKTDLKDFLELLKEAERDVEDQLDNKK